jgi:hypothetical protein
MIVYSPEQIISRADAAGRAAYAAVIRGGGAAGVVERAYSRAYWRTVPPCWIALLAPPIQPRRPKSGPAGGAYWMRNLRIRNRVVRTNKTPSGLVRGFGGPQVYFALERLMQRIAVKLGLDPLEVIRTPVAASASSTRSSPISC